MACVAHAVALDTRRGTCTLSRGSLPGTRTDAHYSPRDEIVAWFNNHFQVTDGQFSCYNKSEKDLRVNTVMSLEVLWRLFVYRGDPSTVADRVLRTRLGMVSKAEFECVLMQLGLAIKSVKNRWVGSISKAVNCRFKQCASDAARGSQGPW